ncbi:MAG: transposase [Actinomycetota bacterium]|nr:transposase [Actinomycetota bacterium]
MAYGVDPETGAGWVLDWEQAEQEDEASWGRLLERLRQRGLSAASGLRLVGSDGGDGLRAALALVDLGPGIRHQRCIFHKLRNVGQAVKAAGGATRAAKRAQRRQVVQEAAAIYQAEERATILERRDAFVTKWQESEPDAVATLLRDFDQTLVYLEVRGSDGERWQARYLRTTSVLERLNRTLRRLVRQVVLFHSPVGLDARVYLTLCEAGAILLPPGDDWLEIVEDALATA